MTKNTLNISLLIAILAVCIYFILFGQRGFIKYNQMTKEIAHEKVKIAKLEQKNEHLMSKIHNWESDDFEKEKFARQELQMSTQNEMVFILSNTNT